MLRHLDVQAEITGGARACQGCPSKLANRAAGRGCKTCDKPPGGSATGSKFCGGAIRGRQAGQSSAACKEVLTASPAPSSDITIFMPPMAEQTISADCGLTRGEATATPMNNANHTSTRRVSSWALRKVCKVDMDRDYDAVNTAHCPARTQSAPRWPGHSIQRCGLCSAKHRHLGDPQAPVLPLRCGF